MTKRQREIKWPEKKNTDYICQSSAEGHQKTFDEGYNRGVEACRKAVEDANPIHKCKCSNEGARTLKRIDEELYQCPRCDGIVVFKEAQSQPDGGYFGTHCHVCHKTVGECGCKGQGELVPLDKAKIYEMLDRYKFAQGYVEFVNELCGTFGTPKAGVEPEEYQCFWCGNGRVKNIEKSLGVGHGYIWQQERCDKAREDFYKHKDSTTPEKGKR